MQKANERLPARGAAHESIGGSTVRSADFERQRRRRRATLKLPRPSASSASVPGSGTEVGAEVLAMRVIIVSRGRGFADAGRLVSATIAARLAAPAINVIFFIVRSSKDRSLVYLRLVRLSFGVQTPCR